MSKDNSRLSLSSAIEFHWKLAIKNPETLILKMSFGKCSFILCFLVLTLKFWDGCSTEARYDHYRLYTVIIRGKAQLEFFQELEAKSENYMFYIRPMFVDQMTAFIVVAHKIPEMEDIIERFGLEATLMVRSGSFISCFLESFIYSSQKD